MSNIGKSSLVRRVAAAAGALALGLAGLAGAALTANAVDPVIKPGNIDSNQSTSLQINKYAGPQGAVGDGTVQTPDSTTHTALAGVEFTITPVTAKGSQSLDENAINSDPAAWDLISKGGKNGGPLTATDDPATSVANADGTAAINGFVFGTPATKVTTDANGVGRLAGGTGDVPTLPHGLYLVTETGHGDNPIVAGTAPFLVTLPLPKVAADNSTNGNWIYDVNVYPKNQVMNAPEKTINSDADQSSNGQLKIGDTVTYTIKQTVPALNKEDTEYKSASIWDTLPDGLEFVPGSSTVTKTGDAFADGDVATDESGATWTVQPDGLKKLAESDVITVTFKAKVKKLTSTGKIANPGSGQPGTPGYGSEFNGTHVPGVPTPYTYWGKLQVTKVDEGGNTLAGAEFSVYENACPAGGAQPTGTPVETGTSGTDGIVQWGADKTSPLGLFVANSNDEEKPDASKQYCVYETKAPAGFIVGASRTVTITPGTTTTANNTVSVTNVQQHHPNLPLTGAAGTVVMTLGGIALVAAGGAAYAISRRKQSAR
jgi:fimbrial isopeptide formation D2 family protein/LPXTG-motif cell wall-anchored protein